MKITEPVISRAMVAAAVTSAVTLLKVLGVNISPELSENIVNALVALAPIAAIIWAAITARRHVTPTASPRTADGRPLVTDSSATDPAPPAAVVTAPPVVEEVPSVPKEEPKPEPEPTPEPLPNSESLFGAP